MAFWSKQSQLQKKKSDLPIFRPVPTTEKKIRFPFRLATVLVSVLCLILLFHRHTEKPHFPPPVRKVDTESLRKFDQGVDHYLITNKGIVSSTDAEFQKELDELYDASVDSFDLSQFNGNSRGETTGDRVLLCIPLRHAEPVLPLMFKNLMNLTYPHELIDIAFLVSDSSDDNTLGSLLDMSLELQRGELEFEEKEDTSMHLKYMKPEYLRAVEKAYAGPHHSNYNTPFNSIQVFEKDFGQVIGQGFSDRHAVKVQGVRRKLMGRARNWLTSVALQPYHSWVYWRDADVELCPGTVLQDLMAHDTDIIVPNVWRPLPEYLGGEQPYDLNSWIESDPALELAKTLDEDDVIVEGYAEYPTWRVHLAYLRDAEGDPNFKINLDGIGGVSILARAKVFRQGVNFAAFTFENHAETEALGKMARKMGFSVGGLPHYVLWHIYEPSEDDIVEMNRRESSVDA